MFWPGYIPRRWTDLETLDDHLEYLAELYATGRIRGYATEEVEGYGSLAGMGIKIRALDMEISEENAPAVATAPKDSD